MAADARGPRSSEEERARVVAAFSQTYSVRGPLPWGGHVSFYLAEEAGRQVVLAILPVDAHAAPSFTRAFALAAGALEDIDSPHLLAATDSGVLSGMPYVEYERARGRLLSDMLAEGPLPSLDVIQIAAQVLEALAKGHELDLFHGDLDPSQVLVQDGEEGPEVKVIGVGLSQLVQAGGGGPLGSSPWADDYAAPEVYRGQASFKSDIYAVGALLHHMVTGHPPSGYESSEGFADIPDLPAVIRRAMARNPAERFESALTMAASLDWLEVLSSQMSPHTQDIPLWMENSMVGSIPVPQINVPQLASIPPALAGGSMRPPSTLPGRPPSRPPSRPPPAMDDEVIELDVDLIDAEALVDGSGRRISSRPPPAMGSGYPLQQPLLSSPPTSTRPARDSNTLMLAAIALLLIILSMLGMALYRLNKRRVAPQVGSPPAATAPATPVGSPP